MNINTSQREFRKSFDDEAETPKAQVQRKPFEMEPVKTSSQPGRQMGSVSTDLPTKPTGDSESCFTEKDSQKADVSTPLASETSKKATTTLSQPDDEQQRRIQEELLSVNDLGRPSNTPRPSSKKTEAVKHGSSDNRSSTITADPSEKPTLSPSLHHESSTTTLKKPEHQGINNLRDDADSDSDYSPSSAHGSTTDLTSAGKDGQRRKTQSKDSSYLRGKLNLEVVQGKNLIPPVSQAMPYVVITFDQNESVSREAARSDTESDNEDNHSVHSAFSFQDDDDAANSKSNADSDIDVLSKRMKAMGTESSAKPFVTPHIRDPTDIPGVVDPGSAALGALPVGPSMQASTSSRGSKPRAPTGDSNTSKKVESHKDTHDSDAASKSIEEFDENTTAATHPVWEHEVQFDVLHERGILQIQIFDRTAGEEKFMGMTELKLRLHAGLEIDRWVPVYARESRDNVGGEIRIRLRYEKFRAAERRGLKVTDFEFLRMIGRGTFGRVFQVRKKDTRRVYAMKVLSKREIVERKEIAHTIGEQKILQQSSDCPFLLGLKFSFQTERDLYLVMDFKSGGELFHHLQREGRFPEPRARFYAAEIVLAFEALHKMDIVYRDLKPENILLDATGHIVLCDFGLSKSDLPSNALTTTFCGTTEYLAPEVLLDEAGYSKLVDFWSLGVLVFEMCCGWSPFYDEDTQQMYKLICFGKVKFPRNVVSDDGKLFVKGLLNRNPKHRLGAQNDAEELKQHPFFKTIDWELLSHRQVPPPFKPHVDSDESTSNFDHEFTSTNLSEEIPKEVQQPAETADHSNGIGIAQASSTGSEPFLTSSVQENFRGFTFNSNSEYLNGQQGSQ